MPPAPVQPVRPGSQTRRVATFFALGFFCVGAPRLFTNAAAFALFLEHFDAKLLPYTYLLGGVSIPVVGVLYLHLARRIGLGQLLMGSLALNLVVLIALRLSLWASDAPWLVFATTVWVEVEWTLGNLVFWGLAERMFDVRQAKRHFAILAAGDPSAAVLGGALLPSMLLIMEVPDLLWMSAASVVVSMALIFHITHRDRERLAAQDLERDTQEALAQSGARRWNARAYLTVVVGLAFAIHIAFFIVDNAFYTLVEARFDDQDAIAGFIGLFYACMGAVTLCINFFAAGRILRHGGLRIALMVVPVLVLLGSAGVVVADMAAATAVVFWAGCLTKLFYDSGWQGIGWPSFLLLYQPLPAHQRTLAQGQLESYWEPIATAVASAMLLLGTGLLGLDTAGLFALGIVVVLAWLALTLPASRFYHRMLSRSIEERGLGEQEMDLDDQDSRQIIRAGLFSPRAGERLYCARLLMDQRRPPRVSVVQRLLADKEPLVRTEILRLLEASPRRDLHQALLQRLDIERFPPTRGALLRALAASAHPDTLELLSAEMDAHSERVRVAAMMGLLRYGGVDGVLAAGERFLGLVRSELPAERKLAARVLAQANVRAFDAHLGELLADRDESVQRAALRAARTALDNAGSQTGHHTASMSGSSALWPALVAMLSRPGLRRDAVATLEAAGGQAGEALLDGFQLTESDPIRRSLLCLLAPIQGAQALLLLHTHRDTLSSDTQHAVLLALQRCAHRARDTQEAMGHELLRDVCTRAFRSLAAIATLEPLPEARLLRDALRTSMARDEDCAVALAAMLLDAPLLRTPWSALSSAEPERAAHVVELIDELLPGEAAKLVTALLESGGAQERLAQMAPMVTEEKLAASDWLSRFAGGPGHEHGPWVQACALYAMGLASKELEAGLLANALDSEHPIVRETALWTLQRSASPLLDGVLDRMLDDESPAVAGLARSLSEAGPMSGAPRSSPGC